MNFNSELTDIIRNMILGQDYLNQIERNALNNHIKQMSAI